MKKLILTTVCAFLLITSYSQTLEKGSVVGTHVGTVKLDPDVTYNQWKTFMVEEYLPAINKEFEGEMKFCFMEGDRGKFEGSYGILLIIKSVEVRDKYWTEFNKSSEAFNTKFGNVYPVYQKLNKLGEFKIEFSSDWIVQ